MLALVALILGVVNAGARSTATTIVTVQVIGKGKVTSDPGGINCGNGDKTCYLGFTQDVTLKASETSDDWVFSGWHGCTPSGTTCSAPNPTVTANFKGPPTPTGTFALSYTGTGNIAARANGADQIKCGTDVSATDCTWTEVQGSTLTAVETPGASFVFSQWTGDCTTNTAN
jgi:hypothetical protein